MKTLHITTPADLISLIVHSLGYWPRERLVCVRLQNNRMGATLRLDLPTSPDHAQTYARRVTSHLGSDPDATASVFAVFADAPWTAEQRELFPPLIHELAQQLAEFGMPTRAGWIVGQTSFAEYQPQTSSYGAEVLLQSVQSSCINAELVFRGSQVQSGLSLALPGSRPMGMCKRRPTPAIPDDGDGAIVSGQSSTRACQWPLKPPSDDAPEESRQTGLKSRLR